MIKVRTASLADAMYVAVHLRDADRAEVKAASGLDPIDALKESFYLSLMNWCVTLNDVPVFVFGIAKWPGRSDIGIPWMLATDDLKLIPRSFARTGVKYVSLMQKTFPILCNFTDVRNKRVIRWLKWMGFSLEETISEYGVEKKPFIKFVRYR